MTTLLRRFIRDQAGQGLVEYGLILSLVAIVAIVGLTTLRDRADNTLISSANAMR